MNRLEKLYLPFLIIIVASAYLLSYYLSYKVNGEDYLLFSLSDGLIYAQYVKNMLLGNFYQYNIGEYTTGTTSFLWPYVIFIFGKILFISPDKVHIVFHIVSFLLIIFSSILSFKTLDILTENKTLSFVGSLTSLLYYKLIWTSMSGLEINFAIFILYLSIYFLISNREKIFIVVSSLFFIIRPEMILLNIPFFVYFLTKKSYKNTCIYLSLIVLWILISFIVYYSISDKFFPSTFYSKSTVISFLSIIKNSIIFIPEYLFSYSENNNSFILFTFIIVGYLLLINKNTPKHIIYTYIGILLFIFYKTILSPGLGQMNRYMIFIEPLILFLFFYSIKDAVNKKYIYILSLAITVFSFIYFSSLKNPAIVNSMNQGSKKMSEYIINNINENEPIAIENAGMKYFLKNKTVDIVGLTSKDLNVQENKYRQNDMSFIFNYLSNNNIKYIQFFPEWFIRIYGSEPPFLEKIYEYKIENPLFNVKIWGLYKFNKKDYNAYISNNDGKK